MDRALVGPIKSRLKAITRTTRPVRDAVLLCRRRKARMTWSEAISTPSTKIAAITQRAYADRRKLGIQHCCWPLIRRNGQGQKHAPNANG